MISCMCMCIYDHINIDVLHYYYILIIVHKFQMLLFLLLGQCYGAQFYIAIMIIVIIFTIIINIQLHTIPLLIIFSHLSPSIFCSFFSLSPLVVNSFCLLVDSIIAVNSLVVIYLHLPLHLIFFSHPVTLLHLVGGTTPDPAVYMSKGPKLCECVCERVNVVSKALSR